VVILASSLVTFLYRSDTQVYLQSVSAYTVSGVPMLSTNGQRCKRRLKTAHWAGILAPLFLNDEFEITVVLDDRDVELGIRVSVSMPGKNFTV